MKDVVGSPGTWTGLVLRVLQCMSAWASVVAMACAYAISMNNYNAFRYMIVSMVLQLVWSFILACVDIYSLKTESDLHNRRGFVWAFVIGDWVGGATVQVMATLTLSAASASAGVVILFERDTDLCKLYMQQTCSEYKLSVILAFLTWSFEAATATSVFWLLASLE